MERADCVGPCCQVWPSRVRVRGGVPNPLPPADPQGPCTDSAERRLRRALLPGAERQAKEDAIRRERERAQARQEREEMARKMLLSIAKGQKEKKK